MIYPANFTILNSDNPLGLLCARRKRLSIKNACYLPFKPIDVIMTGLLPDKKAAQGLMINTAEYPLHKSHVIRFICELFKDNNILFKKKIAS